MPAEKKKRDRYSELFAAYYQMVFNAVFPKVSSVEDTEDICQDVFIALYNNLEEIENVRAWLYGTLKNMVLKYYRSKHPAHDDIDTIMNDVSLSFVNGFRDARIIISEVIEDMTPNEEERQIIELVAFHNYSYSETGNLLGLTKRKVDYKYNKIASTIISKLRERGVAHIEDLL
jgi:RNA polymerase sigma factor (sigma-70 family)